MHYKFKTKPFEHQLKALEMSWDRKVFAYFMEMGTGKSKVLIDNISMLYDKGKINGALIIAPKGVYKNWFADQIPTHMADHIEKTVVLWESSKNKEAEYKKLMRIKGCSLSNLIALGSIVRTDFENFYISISAGSYTVGSKKYYCISAQSPIGKLLLGKQRGDVISFNHRKITIIDLK